MDESKNEFCVGRETYQRDLIRPYQRIARFFMQHISTEQDTHTQGSILENIDFSQKPEERIALHCSDNSCLQRNHGKNPQYENGTPFIRTVLGFYEKRNNQHFIVKKEIDKSYSYNINPAGTILHFGNNKQLGSITWDFNFSPTEKMLNGTVLSK